MACLPTPPSRPPPAAFACAPFSQHPRVRRHAGGSTRRHARGLLAPRMSRADGAAGLPRSVRAARIVIVGAGPTGCLAAAMLHARGVPCTLLEKQRDFLASDVTRAYQQALFPRGLAAVASVPGLLRHLAAFSANSVDRPFAMYQVSPTRAVQGIGVIDGQRRSRAEARRARSGGSYGGDAGGGGGARDDGGNHVVDEDALLRATHFFFRPRLQHEFKSFITGCSHVTSRFGASVEALEWHRDGTIGVTFMHDGDKHLLDCDLLLACDGANSVVVQHLNDKPASQAHVQSRRGFRVQRFGSPAVGIGIKSLVVNPDLIRQLVPPEIADVPKRVNIVGTRRKRPPSQWFRISSFPFARGDVKLLGGQLVTISAPPVHALWELSTAEQAFRFFEDNFPQLRDVRAVIDDQAMHRFVQNRPSFLPWITRPASLTATVGDAARGAVVVLGDAAHAFPPDLGQGINSACEDVATLFDVFESASVDASLAELVERYETQRSPDVDALLRLHKGLSAYQYGHSRLGVAAMMLNARVRVWLATLLPGLAYPSGGAALREPGVGYAEILRRNRRTTAVMVAAATMVVAVLWAVVVFVIM